MKYIDATLPTPEANLACDEALLNECEDGNSEEILRFWEATEPFVVLGYGNKAEQEVNMPACRASEIPVLRRCSGGGTVLQGPGCLSYSLILRITEDGPNRSIAGTNKFVMERNRTAIAKVVAGNVRIQGCTDMAIDGLKFSGNAQRRRKNFLIFHGTFLLRFDISSVEKFLRMPSRQPDYRENRLHGEFITNIGLDPDAIKRALRNEWQATESFNKLPVSEIEKLNHTRYSTPEWNLKF